MSNTFTGESKYRVDEKDRFLVPPEYREALGSVAALIRGDDGQIDVLPKPHFDSLLLKLESSNDSRYRRKARFLRAASTCVVDKQSRITLPEVLKEHAEIGSEVSVIGNGDHFELWNPDHWKRFWRQSVAQNAEQRDDLDAYALEVEG